MAKTLRPEKQRHIEIFWLLRNKTQGIMQALIYITNVSPLRLTGNLLPAAVVSVLAGICYALGAPA